MPRPGLSVAVLAVLALAAQSLTVALPATAATSPTISPEPQQQTVRQDGFELGKTVGLVRGPTTDADAERVVRETLAKAGVRTVQATDGTDPRTPVTIWLGGNDQTLQQLNVQTPAGLPAEGYVLAIGETRKPTRKHLVLAGVDTDGTYYAANSLAQVVRGNRVPGLEIRDWPTMRYRGSIEGFYGTPWSHEDRLDHLDYLGDHRMNTYEYAPKDDPYHRERWRDPYPADKLAQLGELVTRAARNKVDFTFALSPGLSICYTSDSDYQALIAKFESLYALGARSFNVPLDDIDYNSWHCAADEAKYGTGGGAAGQAQSELLNRVQREWVATKPGVAPLQMVPTEYYNVSETPYKKALREQLDAGGGRALDWHRGGPADHHGRPGRAGEGRVRARHPDLGQLPGQRLRGRTAARWRTTAAASPGIADHVAGVISNPMNQAAVSKVALYSFAELGWNPARYDEQASWHRALAERAGGDRRTIEALEVFADLNTYDSTLHPESAPQLAAKTASSGRRGTSGDHAGCRGSVEAVCPGDRGGSRADPCRGGRSGVRGRSEGVARCDRALGSGDAASRFAFWKQLPRATVRRPGRTASRSTSWSSRRRRSATYASRTPAPIRGSAREWSTRSSPRPAGCTTSGWAWSHAVLRQRRWRRTPRTFRPGWSTATTRPSSGATALRTPNDEIRVDLGAVREIGDIAVLMGKAGSPDDFLHSGALEWSADGSSWTELTRATTAEVRVDCAGRHPGSVRPVSRARSQPVLLAGRAGVRSAGH